MSDTHTIAQHNDDVANSIAFIMVIEVLATLRITG